MAVDIKLPFEEFLFASLDEYRQHIAPAPLTRKLWLEHVQRAHAAWTKAHRPQRKAVETDEEWWTRLAADFAGIDVRAEHVLAGIWAKSNNRKCTRKFFENWLLKELRREQKYGEAKPAAPQRPAPIPEPSHFEKWFRHTRPDTPFRPWAALDAPSQRYLAGDFAKNQDRSYLLAR